MKHKTIAAAALMALLAACDSGTDGASDGRTAEGEVLGGTIDDEMLPLDTIRSQSPPLRTEPAGDAETTDAGDGEENEEGEAAAGPSADDAAAEEAEPEPAAPVAEEEPDEESGV